MNIAVIGAGRIGTIRAEVAAAAGDRIVAVADTAPERASALAVRYGAESFLQWERAVAHPRVDAVVVAAFTSAAAEISVAALHRGKHVLCEKPMGRTSTEARAILAAARASSMTLKVGFNHRHHPALWRAHELIASGAIGRAVAVRAVYGHGGRVGYEREWRTDPLLAGGGELLDQGVHLVDLARWFLGEIVSVAGVVRTWYWPVAPLEDNAFALLNTADRRVATLHVSWTQWRNLFRFEVLGTEGYVSAEGLGGSYGTERLNLGRRMPEGARPHEDTWEFVGPDHSWRDEWAEFRGAIRSRRQPIGSGEDGVAAALIVDAIYESSTTNRQVELVASS